MRRVLFVLIALGALGASRAAAQGAQTAPPARTAASVEYVGVDGLYLGVGSDQGVARGDTVAVYGAAEGSEPLGLIVFTSVTRRRAVATVVGATFQLDVGATVFVPLVAPMTADAPEVVPAAPAIVTQASRSTTGGARVSGRIALDLEARETLTSWSGDLFGETRRRFATPTSRLSLVVSDLPGGFEVRTNVRASYRYDDLGGGPPPVSVRAYELAAVKSFESFPLEIVVGRFSNPYERYSAYWDGALVRVGRASGLGAGVAAGYEPELHDESFSTALPKLTAFADFAARGAGWRYDTDASFHVGRPAGGAERRFVGWSQRATLGRFTLDQRLRVDDGGGQTRWSLTQLRVHGALQLGGTLRLRGTYSRSSGLLPMSLPALDSVPAAARREITGGLDLSPGATYLSLEAGRTERDGDAAGLSLYGNAAVPLGTARLLVSSSRWAREDAAAWSVAPALSLRLWSWDWRAGYRLYRTSNDLDDITSHSVEGQVGITLAQGMRLTVLGERQWGSSLSGTRLGLSVWRSF